jgi:hypothetical protein
MYDYAAGVAAEHPLWRALSDWAQYGNRLAGFRDSDSLAGHHALHELGEVGLRFMDVHGAFHGGEGPMHEIIAGEGADSNSPRMGNE